LSPAEEIIHVESVEPIENLYIKYLIIPVENVEKSVETKGSNIVGGDVFDESDFVEHHNLWDEGN
jgi:hypothetical protein